jgi:5-carboxymethyl-2-hydroxymuconate isomerase
VPHIIVECSPNVAESTDLDALAHALHTTAIATGIAPMDALRTRVIVPSHYVIADERPENKYIAIVARLAVGRTPEARDTLLDALVGCVIGQLGDGMDDTALSVEYQEIQPDFRRNVNQLRARLDGPA